jgi:hypothetical protein
VRPYQKIYPKNKKIKKKKRKNNGGVLPVRAFKEYLAGARTHTHT